MQESDVRLLNLAVVDDSQEELETINSVVHQLQTFDDGIGL
ncbi:MAG: hypothetical protein VYA34_01975 [Myxococcota bacterium]|nr:hypothetical protein [Myxococcota bacterium]